jgi:hypothetical protein
MLTDSNGKKKMIFFLLYICGNLVSSNYLNELSGC